MTGAILRVGSPSLIEAYQGGSTINYRGYQPSLAKKQISIACTSSIKTRSYFSFPGLPVQPRPPIQSDIYLVVPKPGGVKRPVWCLYFSSRVFPIPAATIRDLCIPDTFPLLLFTLKPSELTD